MKKKWNLKTGWQNNNDNNDDNNENEPKKVQNSQIIQSVPKRNIVERIIKWIIYAILFIAIPRYLRSSRTKGKEIINSAYTKLNSNEFAFIPAGYALYLFLSFIPVSLILLSIITPIRAEYDIVFRHAILGLIIPGISEIIPENISTVWNNPGGAVALVLLVISVILISSKGYSKFIVSIDALYEHKTSFRAWKGRIKGIFISIVLILGLSLILFAFTAFVTFLIEKAGFGKFPENLKTVKSFKDLEPTLELKLTFYFMVILILPPITYLSFALFYLYSPNFRLKFNQVHPGALITSIPTSLFILIFGSLTSLIQYHKYGPVAAFMYLILLVTFISYFTYAGVIVNSSFYKTFVNIITIDKVSIFKRK